ACAEPRLSCAAWWRWRSRPRRRDEGCLFRRRAVGVFVRRAFDRLREIFGRLRALYGDAAAENEAGHPVDPRVLGRIGLPRHALHVVLAREARACVLGVEAAAATTTSRSVRSPPSVK